MKKWWITIHPCGIGTKRFAMDSWRGEARALLRLGGPLIAAQLVQISMNLADTVMSGWLGPQALAAVGLGGSVWVPTIIFGMGLLMSVSPCVAQSFGSGDSLAVGHHVRQGLWLSQCVAIVSFVVVRRSEVVLHWMQVDAAIIPTATAYLRAVSWGLPASCAFTVLRCYSEAVSITRPIMLISLIGLATNVFGNYVFMYGHLGMPALGAVGTGVATAITMWVMFGCQLACVLGLDYFRRFATFASFELPQSASLRELLKVGAPIGVSLFMECGMFSAVSLLMGRLGATVVAGHQVALNVASVTFMVPLGIAMAITVRVGQAVGRGDFHAARRSGQTGALLAMVFMTCTALVMSAVPETIVGWYTRDREVQRIGATLLVTAAVFQIFDGLQVAGAGALRGLKETTYPMVITAIAYWALGFPLAYWLGIVRSGGPTGLWSGLIGGLVVAAILLNLRFHRVTLGAKPRGMAEGVNTPVVVPMPLPENEYSGFH